MSVYCTFGEFDNTDGIYRAPITYRGSHIIPHHKDPRGGTLDLGYIPAFLTRGGDGYDDAKEHGLSWWPYLRFSLSDKEAWATVVLDRDQVTALRDELTQWLDRIDPDREKDDQPT